MSARLTHLQISDFRSIRGKITVPLDAPVVLIHGPNGSGKTSLLSAIELALTGAVGSLKRFDPAYTDNLVHLDAESNSASVTISANHQDISRASAKLSVANGRIAGEPLLSETQSRFFSERSFLAQATLNRLLEIYEASDARETRSPLTRFVNDLLGLDQLDALIDGLHPSKDKRRLTKSLPLFGLVDDAVNEHSNDVARLETAADAARLLEQEKSLAATKALAPFGVATLDALDTERSQLGNREIESREAIATAALKRDIEAALAVWRRIADTPGADALTAAEATLREREARREVWTTTKRGLLEQSLLAAGALYVDLSPARSIGWSAAHDEAVRELTDELDKLEARLSRDEAVRQAMSERRETLSKAIDREARLDEALGALAANSGKMSELLAELAPLIDSEVCPVCQRDYSETGPVPLRTHLATHISSLSQTASRLRSVANERQSVRGEIIECRKILLGLESEVIDEKELAGLKTRRANLTETLRQLESTGESAREGDTLREAIEAASEGLAALRRKEEAVLAIRRSAADFSERLGLDPPTESEALDVALERSLTAVDLSLSKAARREQDRNTALEALDALALAQARRRELEQELDSARADLERVRTAMKDAESVRADLRKLSDRAVEARTAVVRDVFNESLNKVWNNLFIRLAPEEPFLPAFELPEHGKGPVEAKLITRYRGDDRGGNPKAMLSAGNLNTAALTLFLSLHLSVKPLLPWLIIDDPVQSMDEIHIAQFAALLRTLAKQRGRQVIIAVHERPLFEYLALELSPASLGDKLITVELSRDADRRTICNPETIIWNPETIYRAALS